MLRQAVADHQSGDLNAAASAYEQVLAKDPDNGDATHLLGLIRLQTNDVDGALALLLSAVRLRPENGVFRFNLALAQVAAERSGEAAESYRRSLELNPQNAAAVNNLAVLLGEEGDLGAAEDVLRQGLARISGDIAMAVNLADVLCRKALPEQLLEAEALCREVLARAPDMAKAHAVLAHSMSIGDRRGEAVPALEQATVLEPDNARYHEQLADLYAKMGDNAAAETAARRSVELDEGRARSAGILGTALLGLNKIAEAIEWSRRAILLDPHGLDLSEAFAAANLYVAHLKGGDGAEAAQLVDLDNLVYPHEIAPPPGYDDVAAFNQALERAIRGHPSLQWNPSGYVTRSGAITGNVLLQPTGEFSAMEGAIRQGIDAFTKSLSDEPGHHFRRQLTRRYRMVMWAVILDQEGYLETHIHEGSWISGAYYVSIPDFQDGRQEDHPGCIEFGRPAKHFEVDEGFPIRVVRPSDGRLVLFPSSMFHRTIPFQADAERICISFNCFPY
ncbi:MAG: tetratricopeptide repeat protein [Rhodospirillaceae bacterium]|nr:tetratricopeptide repeat protein [Rhodospirillaceae bacterium]MBT4491294.1 tetratricopeptide repeat protein [Rhodospirillaceae bacterium]MBT5191054.1 tetratricopeptide repeat protein [Rhodospirillaceae bacterium]MBT5895578.1 tetratricopeptide repeat protein [Rhodospirillaceae bacterium]MBT6428436.1 tetratricopeptide repeat protein [Rhodospirillaceae bacterium]